MSCPLPYALQCSAMLCHSILQFDHFVPINRYRVRESRGSGSVGNLIITEILPQTVPIASNRIASATNGVAVESNNTSIPMKSNNTSSGHSGGSGGLQFDAKAEEVGFIVVLEKKQLYPQLSAAQHKKLEGMGSHLELEEGYGVRNYSLRNGDGSAVMCGVSIGDRVHVSIESAVSVLECETHNGKRLRDTNDDICVNVDENVYGNRVQAQSVITDIEDFGKSIAGNFKSNSADPDGWSVSHAEPNLCAGLVLSPRD